MATRYDRPGGTTFGQGPSMVRWGAILAGSVIGIGLLLLFGTLWAAWAQDATAIADNIEWYSGATAIVSLFIAGLLAGWLSGTRGFGPGVAHGLTVWGLVLTGALLIGAPQAVDTFDTVAAAEDFLGDTPVWGAFWALLIGLVTAAAGGVLGGAIPRPSSFFETMGGSDDRDRDYDRDRDRDIDVREPGMVEGSARTDVRQGQDYPTQQPVGQQSGARQQTGGRQQGGQQPRQQF
jgi:hypothetical protein